MDFQIKHGSKSIQMSLNSPSQGGETRPSSMRNSEMASSNQCILCLLRAAMSVGFKDEKHRTSDCCKATH